MKAKLQLYIEGNRVDLFSDESVNIIQSIQNVKDISKVFVEFTRTFNVPASKKNNKIFQHYYNYSISGGFDARLKKNSTIELNSRPFKTGKIKLDGVDLEDGSPNTYRITFFGNTIDLNDLLGDDDLSALDLTAFDSTYTPAEVKSALEGGLNKTYTRADTSTINYPQGIIAPLISHTTRLYYEASTTAVYPDPLGGNLYPSGTNHQGVYYEELKYAIRADAIIKAIEDKYGLTFSNDFFNTTNSAYYGLYLWLHRKKGKAFEEAAVTKQVTGFTIDYNQEIPEVTSYADRLVVQNVTSGSIQYSLTIESTTSIDGTVIIKKDGGSFDQREISGTSITLNGYLTNGTYTVFINSSETSFTLSTNTQWDLDPTYYPDSAAAYPLTSTFAFNNTRSFIISEQMPEMKVIDFLTGLFQLFNLTAYTENGTIIVKTLNEYYSDSTTVWDITNNVDTTKSTVDVALPYKEVEFRYEGLDTKLAKQHEQINNTSWGTESYSGDNYYDANPEIYSVIAPFEHMKYERLYNGSTAIEPQVGWFVDDNNEAYFGKPLLFYAYNQTSATAIRFLETENAGTYADITSYFIPSNSVDIDSTVSDVSNNFRNEINEYTNTNAFDKTLFAQYYQSYISQVFQENRRLTTVYAYLPLKMLQEFILADTIAISDKNYTINEIETDFKTGRSKLELINGLTVSVGGSTPITTTTTIDPSEECTECTADSTFCTVDSLTPTADKTCDVGRSLVISGQTSQQQTEDITLTATANNFIGTATYLWSGGNAAGLTTSSITITNATTGNVTYTCVATDSDDSAEFTDTHIVLWTPKTYVITLNVIDNISSPTSAAYNVTGDQTGSTQTLQQGETYSFSTNVSVNSGYQFTSGPSILNATGTVGTSNLTVNTTLTGTVQATSQFLTISGPTAKTVNNNITLFATPSGFTPTSYSWSGGSASGSTQSITFTETSAGTYVYTCTATDGTITATDTHTVVWTTQTLIDITLAIDTSAITAPANSFTITGDQAGLVKSQNSGTVFSFSSGIELNSGFEYVGSAPTVNNAGGTFTTSQTVTTVFGSATIQLIVYNYYVVTGCAGQTVAGQTIYVRSRDTFTVGNSTTGTYITINNLCYYTSATAFETDWATNNGVTVGNGEGTGCDACTGGGTTTDPCLATKSVFYLRYSTSNDVCENQQSKNFYYVNGSSLSQTNSNWCSVTDLFTYADCTAAAPTGYYSLDNDNTDRRYWNGSSFSVCVNCIDANGLYYLGQNWDPTQDFCDSSQGVFGYYYFDNNKTLITATSNDDMYSSAANIGTPNKAAEGFYTDLSNYRYYEPNTAQVWENYGGCPVRPTTTSTTTIPTLTVFRQYGDCATGGLDATKVFGNNSTSGFPFVIEDENGDCWSNPQFTATSSTDWIGDSAFTHYNDCVSCTGTTTTTTTTTTTQAPDNVFVVERQSDGFATYVQLDSGYQVGNTDITISTDGATCYDIAGTALVTNPTSFGTITGSCITTTTTTTTTTITCGSQTLYKSAVSATDVCCNVVAARTVYMDSNSITTATTIYQDNACSATLASDQYFSEDFGDYYFWNSTTNTLTGPTTCPACP